MPGTTSSADLARAVGVSTSEETLDVQLDDGRSLSIPLAWYPRLSHATVDERKEWSLIGGGSGIHWPRLDEDIAIDDLLAGRPSGESQESLARWLAARAAE